MIRMGRSSRTEDTPEPTTQPAANDAYRYETAQPTTQTRAISESDSMARDIKEGRLSGFVGHGTTLTGETEFQAMLRVDGHLIGTVASATGTLIVGTNGQVDANVSVAAAMINGTVNGDIVATEKLQLGRTARVMGNIQSPKLIVEEGAILEGSCSMLKARENREKAVAAATPPPVVEPPQPTIIPMAMDDDDQPELLAAEDDETAESATA